MNQQPSLASERMVLEQLTAEDVPVVQRLTRRRKIAHTIHWVFLLYSEIVSHLVSGRVLAKAPGRFVRSQWRLGGRRFEAIPGFRDAQKSFRFESLAAMRATPTTRVRGS